MLRSRILTLVLMVFVAACAPRVAPPGTTPTAPRLTESAFITSDGLELAARRWMPEGDPKFVVLAVHGFNDYSKAFDKVPDAPGVGPFLAARGAAVYAYDQRGFGKSPHFGLWPGRETMIADYKDFARVLKAMYPGAPIYGLGESMGGAVVMSAMAGADPPPLAGVVLAAPAVWGRSTMPLLYRGALWTATHIVPGWKPTGQSLGRMASDNIEMLRDNGRDPLFIKRTRIDAVYGLTGLMDQALDAAPKIKTPVLYLYGHYDQIIPKKPTKQALAALAASDANLRTAYYGKSWHMILRDKAAPVVLEDVAAFLTDPSAPLPSGADADALPRLKAANEDCPPC